MLFRMSSITVCCDYVVLWGIPHEHFYFEGICAILSMGTLTMKMLIKADDKLHVRIMLMKVLSHPGHGNSKCCTVVNWTCFSLLKMFHHSSEKLLQF